MIMDFSWYNNECLRQLHDATMYLQLESEEVMMPPSAIAGNRVNRECYMQVHERGCTTPALVRFSVAGF